MTALAANTDYAAYPDHPLHGVPQRVLELARAEVRTAALWRDVVTDPDMIDPLADAIVAAVLALVAAWFSIAEPGGEVHEEWMAEVDMGAGFKPRPHPSVPFIFKSEADVDRYLRGIVKPKRKMTRTVHTGPWRPAP